MKYSTLRTNILLLVIILTLCLFFFISYNNYKDKESILFKVSLEKLQIQTEVLKKYQEKQLDIYANRYKSISKNKHLLSLIQKKRITALKYNIDRKYKVYKKLTPELKHMALYDAKGHYLYNSDKEKIKRNLVLKEAKKTKSFTMGYVVFNKKDYYNSFISPIFKNKKLIGYLEFGTVSDNLFKVVSQAGKYQYAVFLNNNKKISKNRVYGDIVTTNSAVFEHLTINQALIDTYANKNKILTLHNKSYYLHQYNVQTEFEKNFAQVLILTDVSQYVQDNIDSTTTSFTLSLIVLFLVYLTIYFILTLLINKLLNEEDKIANKQVQMQTIMDNSNSLITLFNHGELVLANNTLLKFTSFENLQSLQSKHENFAELFLEHPDTFNAKECKTNIEWIHELTLLPESQRVVAIANKYSGIDYFSVRIKIVPKQPHSIIVIFQNISSIFTKSKEDEYLANHDTLTNIYNRQYFNKAMENVLQKFKTTAQESSLLLFDLDFFKQVNDTYGHQVGDDVLMSFSKLVSQQIRSEDIFARWGGEEFVLLLYEAQESDAVRIANNLRELVENTQIPIVGNIHCSIGVSQSQENDTLQSWLQRVDQALYRAKENGRNRVEVL